LCGSTKDTYASLFNVSVRLRLDCKELLVIPSQMRLMEKVAALKSHSFHDSKQSF